VTPGWVIPIAVVCLLVVVPALLVFGLPALIRAIR
jgi:hypothetical protein